MSRPPREARPRDAAPTRGSERDAGPTGRGDLTGLVRPWVLTGAEVAAALGSDCRVGLTPDDVVGRRERWGSNELVEQGGRSRRALLASQFANTMTVLLAVAAIVTGLLGDLKDTVVIALILVMNALVGFAQEHRAERAMAALRRLAADGARVVRSGRVADVAAAELVPGDLVCLAAGEIVPADLRLVEARALRVDEAALTGESEPSEKFVDPLAEHEGSLVADRHNMAFKGTAVTYGRGRGLVVGTGMATELGRIAALVQTHAGGPTPLQRRLAGLGQRLAAAALVVCIVVFVAGVLSGEDVDRMFLTAVSLAVAAIPEGLPAVVTVALALGARRMADRHALVRRLAAVETLGSVTVICSDKTGTLTENRMVVERVWTPAGSYVVTGEGYEPSGSFEGPDRPDAAALLDRAALVAAACNDADLHAPVGPGGTWRITGDPTEGALLALAGKRDVSRARLEHARPRLAELAFDPGRRLMTTLHRDGGRIWVAAKGALARLGPLVDPGDRALLAAAGEVADEWAAQGYRVLALADRELDRLPDPLEEAERDLRLVGVVAMADPPRADALRAIASCREAGVRPVMITGDHPRTAEVVARRVGLLTDGRLLTGADLDALDDAALVALVPHVEVFARTDPAHKLRIVEAWKAAGAIVAMTGDGVNDAPALRCADIGVAMGVVGTDVSKEAADMVLADDDFATIVHAVEEGRRIHDNIRRFVRYLLTTNSGEVWVMFLAPLVGLPVPLLPVQILWINLVTDGPPAIALGLEPAEPGTMRRPPVPPGESVLGDGLWQHALWVGLVMAAATIAVLAAARAAGWPWRTMVFTTLALLQLGNSLAERSEHRSVFALGRRTNPWLGRVVAATIGVQLALVYVPALHGIFGTQALGPAQLATVALASTAGLVAVELGKLARRWRGRTGVPVLPGPTTLLPDGRYGQDGVRQPTGEKLA